MKRLLLAVGLALLAAGTARAEPDHGLPIFFFPAPQEYPNLLPQGNLSQPVTPSGGFYWAPPQIARERDGTRRVVEEVYKDGRLFERRVKCYPANWAGYKR